jgi:predicted nuclease with TOPRIM domain
VKLKLENQLGVTILSVTEDISPSDCAILRAGVTKLFQLGKKNIFLDLLGSNRSTPDSLKEIASLQSLAAEAGATLLMISQHSSFSHATSREEAFRKIRSSKDALLGMQADLAARTQSLEKRKAELTQQLASSTGDEQLLKSLKKENTELRKHIKELESQVQSLLKIRRAPLVNEITDERIKEVANTLTAILEQEGVIPVI